MWVQNLSSTFRLVKILFIRILKKQHTNLKNTFYISLFILLCAGTSATAKEVLPFEKGKRIVDSVLALTPKFLPFQSEEQGAETLAIAQEIGYKIGEGKTLNKLGISYQIERKEDKTFECLNKANDIFEKFGEDSDRLDNLFLLTDANRIFYNYKESLDLGEQTIKLAKQLQDSLIIGKAIWCSAVINLKIDKKEKYFELGEQALSIFKRIGDAENMAEAYIRLGCIMPDYEKRFQYFSEAEKVLPDIENEKVRKSKKWLLYQFISIAWLDIKDYEKAEPPARVALQIAKELNDSEAIAVMNEFLSKIEFHLYKNYDKAAEHAKKQLQYEKSIGRYYYVIPTAMFLKEIYAAAGHPEKALEYADVGMLYMDSLYWANRKNDAEEIEKAYELERRYAEINRLENERRTRTFMGIGSTVFFLLLACFFFWQRQLKNRHLQVQEQLTSQLQTQKEELADLNATKDRFFAIIAHDMRNAVYSFRGVTDKITFFIESNQPERIQKFGSQIDSAVSNLTNLMNNLLEWALVQRNAIPYKPEYLNVRQTVRHAIEILQNSAKKKGIDLRNETPEDLTVFADKNAVLTIIRNLVSNAIKFTSTGGKVSVNVILEDDFVKVEIEDTGIGMSEKQVDSLFQIDKKMTQKGTAGERGSGLGLVLVRELIELNKGKIMAESTKGKGTKICFTLPLVKKENLLESV